MLPPHELKNKPFTKALRGYSTVEVDEHISFVIDKYTELYRENDELERKLRLALAQLDSYKNDEESIRTALINTQKACQRITSEANTRAELILNATKSNCDRILTEFHARIRKERDTLTKLENAVVSFKTALYQQYSTQIHEVEALTIRPEGEDIPDEEYVRKIVENIKLDVSRITASADNTRDDEEIPEEISVLIHDGEDAPSEKEPESVESEAISDNADAPQEMPAEADEPVPETAEQAEAENPKDDDKAQEESESKAAPDSPDDYMQMLKEASEKKK